MAKKEVLHMAPMGQQQEMGTVVGRRGAGITTITPGDPLMHSFNQYAKDGASGMDMAGPPQPIIGSSRRTSFRGF